jgi:hypothetical protein
MKLVKCDPPSNSFSVTSYFFSACGLMANTRLLRGPQRIHRSDLTCPRTPDACDNTTTPKYPGNRSDRIWLQNAMHNAQDDIRLVRACIILLWKCRFHMFWEDNDQHYLPLHFMYYDICLSLYVGGRAQADTCNPPPRKHISSCRRPYQLIQIYVTDGWIQISLASSQKLSPKCIYTVMKLTDW